MTQIKLHKFVCFKKLQPFLFYKVSHNFTDTILQPRDGLQMKTVKFSTSNYYYITKAYRKPLKKNLSKQGSHIKELFSQNLENRTNEYQNNIENPRISELNIHMLSKSLYQQLFGQDSNKSLKDSTLESVEKSILHLKQHGLWGKETHTFPDVEFKLPPLKGNSLKEHFHALGHEQSEVYKSLVKTLIKSTCPNPPNEFNFSEGWTKYEDGKMKKVDFPTCSSLIFDIEVCMAEGRHPTLACAVSDKYWYSWCSPSFINARKVTCPKLNDLISFGNIKPKVVIAHNVAFDRLAIKEEYFIDDNYIRFLDTMALHISLSGLVEAQRNLMKSSKNSPHVHQAWMNTGCMNNLKDVFKFYCKEDLKKESREIFVKGSIEDVRNNFQDLMTYCASDVQATYKLVTKLFPLFLERCPHTVSFAGMLEMSKSYLPICSSWDKYINLCEEKYNELRASLTHELAQKALEALEMQKEEKYKLDIWLWDLDWSLPKGHVKELANYPNWYRKLCMRTKDRCIDNKPQNMSVSLQVVPKLLNLTWKGYPLHFVRGLGWGYLKPIKKKLSEEDNEKIDDSGNQNISFPYETLLDMTQSIAENETNCHLPGVNIGIPNVIFHPLPHKDGEGKRVGNPLSKHYLSKIEDNTLSSAVSHIAKLVLQTTKTISYWKNNRDRILSQIVMHLDPKYLPSSVIKSVEFDKNEKYGAILPQTVPGGTITRRAVDRTWMTASNAYVDRIGSELKGIIKAPPGYHFVGADVDSQELWIASVLGDAYHSGLHGSTALGWMTLQGNKAQGTDMHSVTAKTVGISRDQAKVVNYGRIYGAGLKFMKQLLKQFNSTLTDREIDERAGKLFRATKGEKGWYLSSEGKELAELVGFKYSGQPLSRKQIYSLLDMGRHEGHLQWTWEEVVERGTVAWVGGSESHMFNCLEAIACMDKPETPVLGARITKALEPWFVGDKFMTSRVNWVVQSSAVDFLHLMLVSMRWLFKEFNIRGRFAISIHDEVRYLVASEDRYRAALALQITNLLTRSFISSKLNLNDLPQSVAFFSGVDIDKVLRKEPSMDCVTPSNPEGLSKGYDIPPGETLDIYQILDKTGGNLSNNNIKSE